MQIKFEGEINTDVELPMVFKVFKQFMMENLQNYSFSMSDDKETLEDKLHTLKVIDIDKLMTKTVHADAIVKINEPTKVMQKDLKYEVNETDPIKDIERLEKDDEVVLG